MRTLCGTLISLLFLTQFGCGLVPTDSKTPQLPHITSTSSITVVSEALVVPPQVQLGQTFQAGVALRNTSGSPVTYAEIAVAIIRPDGLIAFNALDQHFVTIDPGESWSAAKIVSLPFTGPTGTYKAVVRGRLQGDVWFDFPAQNNANPKEFLGFTSPAFAAVVEAVNVNPSSVGPNQRPGLTASIRNTSTLDTEWKGAATFWVKATVRRNGTVLTRQNWREAFDPDESRTTFEITADYDTSVPGKYEVTYDIFSGDDVYQFATRTAEFWIDVQHSRACAPPPEANTPQSYTAFWRPPYGFTGATPWLQVVQDGGGTDSSMVEIDFIRLWAKEGGVSRLVATNEYDDEQFGGQLCSRVPWFGDGSCHSMPGSVSNGALIIRPVSHPDSVWHPYMESYPELRVDISNADSVWMETRLRITGPALVQAGLDYWKYRGYRANNRNEEAGATDWYCHQGSWHTLRLSRSTEVVDSIAFASQSGSNFHAGIPISANFRLANHDDETVQLAEFGVEVRTMGDNHCDWKNSTDPDPVSAFSWRQNVSLAPGESIQHTSNWTPAAGRYCATVVERRANSTYRKSYLPTRFQVLNVH